MTSVFLYLVAFQLALGPMPSFIGAGKCEFLLLLLNSFIHLSLLAELFEVSSRSAALSLGNQVGWGCNFLVGFLFPTIYSLLGF